MVYECEAGIETGKPSAYQPVFPPWGRPDIAMDCTNNVTIIDTASSFSCFFLGHLSRRKLWCRPGPRPLSSLHDTNPALKHDNVLVARYGVAISNMNVMCHQSCIPIRLIRTTMCIALHRFASYIALFARSSAVAAWCQALPRFFSPHVEIWATAVQRQRRKKTLVNRSSGALDGPWWAPIGVRMWLE